MAFRVSEAEADGNLLKRRGLGTTPFYPSKTRNADGISRVWMTASLDAAACAGLPTLLVGDHPDQPAWPQSPFRADAHACVSGLDHIVVTTLNPDRAAALYGARLGLDLRLDRTSPEWGTRFLFFRTGGATVEVVHSLKAEVSDAPDRFMGLTWLVPDIDATHARLSAQGLNLSEIRTGRRKGSRVFTLREAPAGIATLFLSQDPAEAET
jgi:catechol 2,3-dioxygenase-like lactoylglutathione lyase family enzyme